MRLEKLGNEQGENDRFRIVMVYVWLHFKTKQHL